MRKLFGITLAFILSATISIAQTFDNGVQKFDNGDYATANQTFEELLNSDRNNSEIHFYLGRIDFEYEKFKDAIKHFENAADLDSDNSKYHMWLGHSFGRQAQEASLLKQGGLARKSRRNYEKSIELNPTNIEARESIMEFYLQAPKFVGGGRDKAENEAKEIEHLNTEAGISAWGRVYSYYEEYDSAEKHFIKAIEEHPELMAPYYELYATYFNRNEFEKAADIAIQQLQVNDTTAAIYYNLGNAQQRYALFDQALENYYKTLELEPEFNITYYQVGRLAAVSGIHLEVGKEYINRFIDFGDEVGDSWLAWAYYRLGSIEEHLDSKENAITSYELALQFNKDHEQAKDALSALK